MIVEGVSTITDAYGEITHVTIDVQKHREALPVLKEMGLIEKSQFDIDWENSIPSAESRQKTLAFVRKLWHR